MPRYPFTLPDGRSGTVTATDPEDAAVQLKTKVLPDMLRRASDVGGQVQDLPGQAPTSSGMKPSSYNIPEGSAPPWPTKYAIPRDTPPGAPPITEPPPGPSAGWGSPGMPARPLQTDETPTPAPPTKPPVDRAAALKAQQDADRKLYDPAKGMNWLEKGAVGFQSGLRDSITGAKDLVGLASDDDLAERKDREERNKPLGNWGKAGTALGQAAATAPLAIPGAGAAGAVLTKAVPLAAKVAQYGGKVLNLGSVGSGAVQGAITSGITGSTGDQGDLVARAKDALEGAAAGAIAPLALKTALLPFQAVIKGVGAISDIIKPGAKELQKRAYDAISKTIGEQGVADARMAMEHADPSMVPETSAVMSQSPALGAMERGARTRGNADFNSHDENVARQAWDTLHMTGEPTEAGAALRSRFMRDGIAQTPQQFGQAPNIVPNIESHPLRLTLAKVKNGLSPDEADTATQLANDLARQDIVKSGQGTTTPDVSKWTDHVPMALGALFHTKTFGMAHQFLNRAKFSAINDLKLSNQDKVMKEVDEALLSPDKFMSMVDEVQKRVTGNQPLTDTQKVMKSIAEQATDMMSRTAAATTN